MHGFLSDIRYAFRTLRHSSISTLVAVLSLAVGVGANAAIFSVGYAMLVRPLPYAGADRLVMLHPMNPSHGVLWTTVAPANLLDWQAQAKSFEAIAAYRWRTVDLTGGDRSERLRGLHITPEFFKVLNKIHNVDGPRSLSAVAFGSVASDRTQVFLAGFWTST